MGLQGMVRYVKINRKRLRNTDIFKEKLLECTKSSVIVGALGCVTNKIEMWFEKLGITISIGLLQKKALLGTTKILRKVLET